MAWNAGVKVEIISNDQSLPLYPDPDAENIGNPEATTQYVEAVTDATFEVSVTLEKEFRWGTGDVVRVFVKFDGEHNGWALDLLYDDNPKKAQYRPRATFTRRTFWCPASQQWKAGKLSFGALKTKEQTDSKADLSRVANLGRISLLVQRVRYTQQESVQYAGQETSHYIQVSEISEKTLKGKAITNTVQSADSKPASQPVSAREVQAIPAPKGTPLRYDILYRSRRTLQMLGCITRSPSSESEDIDERGASAGNTNRDREIQGLRARLALLERDNRVKTEPSNSITGIKRERADVEVVSTRKRSRKSEATEVVDLTSD